MVCQGKSKPSCLHIMQEYSGLYGGEKSRPDRNFLK